MANRIISFNQDPVQKRLQDNPFEVFLDISMQSKPVTVYQHYVVKTAPKLSDYYMLLAAEDGQTSVVTEQTSANIALFPDNSYSNVIVSTDVSSDQTYQISRLVNVNAIRNSLDNIFSWTPGERVLLPEFGTNLRRLLYEGITDFNTEQIVAEIKYAVSQWEPRINVTNIVDVSTIDDHENNIIHLKVIYVIPGLSDQQFEYDYISNAERRG